MKQLLVIATLVFFACACNNKSADFDANGALLATALTSNEGAINFNPMKHEDSAYVNNYTPTVYTYNNEPYTGKIAYYENEKLFMEGTLINGIFDGEFIFYYPSGVVQIAGNYRKGMETGFWKSYYRKDYYNIVKYYDDKGYLLMRKEYFDNGKVKNYQNIECAEFGNIERRIQFKYNGEIDYLDAEREVGKLDPAAVNKLLQNDGLMIK